MKKLFLILALLPFILSAQTHNFNNDTSMASINGVDTADIYSVNESVWLGYGGSSAEPSYSNPCGMGDRTDSITVTSDYVTGGDPNLLVDGDESTDEIWLPGSAVSGHYIRFDFGSGISKVINEITWIQTYSDAQGTWIFQGSNNASDWTDIGNSFTLAGVDGITVHTAMSGNTSGYRYYQLLGVSGNSSSSPYIYEIRFKIDDY